MADGIVDGLLKNAKGNFFQTKKEVKKGIRDWYYGEDGKGGGFQDELRSRKGWTTQDYVDNIRENLAAVREKYRNRNTEDQMNKTNEYLSTPEEYEVDKEKSPGPKMFLENFKDKLMNLKNFNF